MISEGIEIIDSMSEMAELEEAVRFLIRRRRTAILLARKASGAQVGFVQRKRIRGKVIEQACNGTVEDVKGEYAYVKVVAPIRFATALIQIEMPLLRDPFLIVEKIYVEADDGQDEESDGSGPLPVPLG